MSEEAQRTSEEPAEVHPSNELNDLSSKEWVQLTKSWFVVDGTPSDITEDVSLHPASFPPEMVSRFIRFFTKEGETVLDPFVGTGGTLVAAFHEGRKGIGVELHDSFYENTVKRLDRLSPDLFSENVTPEVHQGDSRKIKSIVDEEIHFCITSPPYWKMLKTSRGNVDSVLKEREKQGLPTDYGDHSDDISMIEHYERYVDELVGIFAKIGDVMMPNRYIVVVMQNVRTPDGEMKPLAWDFAREMRDHFILQQEFIWCQDQKPLGCWGYPYTYVSNVHHHYCLVFKNSR